MHEYLVMQSLKIHAYLYFLTDTPVIKPSEELRRNSSLKKHISCYILKEFTSSDGKKLYRQGVRELALSRSLQHELRSVV